MGGIDDPARMSTNSWWSASNQRPAMRPAWSAFISLRCCRDAERGEKIDEAVLAEIMGTHLDSGAHKHTHRRGHADRVVYLPICDATDIISSEFGAAPKPPLSAR